MRYQLWKFLHIASAFIFVASHGVSMGVTFRLRRERDREKIRDLLAFSGTTIMHMYISLALTVLFGVFTARAIRAFWQQWITLSIIVLVATIAGMYLVATRYYRGLKDAVAVRPSGVPRVSDADLEARLTSWQPWAVTVIGFGGLLGIIYLMVFKPL